MSHAHSPSYSHNSISCNFLCFSISPNRAEHKGLGAAVGTGHAYPSGTLETQHILGHILNSKTQGFFNYFVSLTLKNLKPFKDILSYKYSLHFYHALGIMLISGNPVVSKINTVLVLGKLLREKNCKRLTTFFSENPTLKQTQIGT